jgi:uncharacterized protein
VNFLKSVAELEVIYSARPKLASTAKEIDYLIPAYRSLIAASPFVVLATSGPEGLDCSPRGDLQGFVRVIDDRTLAIPDRRGNNRIDSLRNIIRDPRAALLFLIPGSGTTFRVNGKARLTDDADILASFAVDNQMPRSVIILKIEACYFQCARAILRSDLWGAENRVRESTLATPGQILEELTSSGIDAKNYDIEWPERAKGSMW